MQYFIRFCGTLVAVFGAFFCRDVRADLCDWTPDNKRIVVQDKKQVYCKLSAEYIRGSNLMGDKYVFPCDNDGWKYVKVTDAAPNIKGVITGVLSITGDVPNGFRVYCNGGKMSDAPLVPVVDTYLACTHLATGSKDQVEESASGCVTMRYDEWLADCGVTGVNGSLVGWSGSGFTSNDMTESILCDGTDGTNCKMFTVSGWRSGVYWGCPSGCRVPDKVSAVSGNDAYSFVPGFASGTNGCTEHNKYSCNVFVPGMVSGNWADAPKPDFPAYGTLDWQCCPEPSSAAYQNVPIVYVPSDTYGTGINHCILDPMWMTGFTSGDNKYIYPYCHP